MNHLIAQRGLQGQIECDSAGTGAYHVGEPPDRRMSAAAANQPGIKLQGRARQFSSVDFADFDLILAMDRDNYWGILARDPDRKYRDKVKMMCDFCRHHDLKEVPDPYYGGPEGFQQVIDLLLDACEGLLETLIQEGKVTPPED